jgi:hypothetical protein
MLKIYTSDKVKCIYLVVDVACAFIVIADCSQTQSHKDLYFTRFMVLMLTFRNLLHLLVNFEYGGICVRQFSVTMIKYLRRR